MNAGSGGIALRPWGRRALLLLLLLLLLPMLLAGCLEDANDKCFAFDNPVDPNVSSECEGAQSTTTTSAGNVVIFSVTTLNEVVILLNTGLQSEDMTGWILSNDSTPAGMDEFIFPGFTLAAGRAVRVHSSATGSPDAENLYWDGIGHWGGNESALLTDDEGNLVANCSDGQICWDGGL